MGIIRILDEAQPEQHEGVDELVHLAVLVSREVSVGTDEAALFELGQGGGEGAAIREAGEPQYGRAVYARLARRQGTDDGNVTLGMAEQRTEQRVELVPQASGLGKAEEVDVLRKSVTTIEQPEVVRDCLLRAKP